MRKLTIIFWLLFWVLVYQFTVLQKDTSSTDNKFTIFRDPEGLPHIYAKNYNDLFFGLGYAQAQDRLFTLYFKKMLLEGRLAELFGPSAVGSDLEMRNIGFMQMGKMNILHTDPTTREHLQQFVNGINQYARSTKMLPFEFYIFWLTWEDWKVENCLANINLLSFTLEFDWFYQIARQRLLETVGFDLGIKTITYGSRNLFKNTTIISDEELKEMGRYQHYDSDKQNQVLRNHWANNNISLGSVHFPKIQFAVQGSGSNGWVIGGEHTESGRPILASDPHLASLLPSLFYSHEVILLTADNRVKSRKFCVMPDGFPTCSVGVSQIAAWGSTAAYIDNKDVYYETVRNQSGKMEYLFKDEWHEFTQRKQLIKVRGAQDIEQVFYHTHRGVALESIFMDIHWKYGYPLPQKYTDNHTVTLVATHYRPDNSSAAGLTAMLTFQTEEEFDEAGDKINYPNIDSFFIFMNGSYGYRSIGAIPKRQIPEMGSFIKDGNKDDYMMGEYLNRQEKPNLLNPKKGFLSMCNNRFASDNFEFRSSLHEIVTGRSYRLETLIKDKIKKGEKFNFKDTQNMQLDQRDQFVASVFPQFLGRLTHFRQIWSNPRTEQIFKKLEGWNFVMGKDSIEASFYHVWEYLFQHSMFQLVSLNEQEIHAIINHGFFQNYQFTLLEKFGKGTLTGQENPICESVETRKIKNTHPCEASIALAFRNLPDQLQRLFGSKDILSYRWGIIHKQVYKVIPWGQIPLLNKIWARDYERGGSSRTLNVAIHTHQSKSYNSLGSPVFRFITDLNRTLYSLQTGESDRVLSPFYDNFLAKDKYIEYIPRNPYLEGIPQGWTTVIDKLN